MINDDKLVTINILLNQFSIISILNKFINKIFFKYVVDNAE